MKYAILIYGEEVQSARVTPKEMETMSEGYAIYTRELIDAGVMKGGEALQPTATATSVRYQGAKKALIHGPFAETKEQLLGFYLVEVPHLDDAVEWAAKCPGAKTGTVEVRPVREMNM